MSKDKKVIVWAGPGREEIMSDLLYDGIKFVSKAKSADVKAGHALGYLLFDAPYLVATDGHRLHNFVVDEDIFYPMHHYEVIHISTSEAHLGDIGELENSYGSDWRKVWPDGLYQEIDGSFPVKGLDLSETYTKIIRTMENHKTINFVFLKDLALMEYCEVGFHHDNPVFKAGRMGAVIMPLRVE